MRVMVTGSNGMLGHKVVAALRSNPLYKDVIEVTRQACDLSDYARLLQLLTAEKPDIIVHCAAKVSGIAANSRNPADFFRSNQEIDQNIIWGAFEKNIGKVLLIGSSSMYPPSDQAIGEDALATGFPDPGNYGYGLSKAISCCLVSMLNGHGSTRYRTLVAPNLYGEKDRANVHTAHLLNAILLKIMAAQDKGDKDVIMWGDGSARREFLYSGDLATYISDTVLDNFDHLPPLLNVGYGKDHSVREFHEIGANILNWTGKIIPDPSKPSGAARKLLNSERAKKSYGWQAMTPIEKGMQILATELKTGRISGG